jgi:hypothetical protein
MLAAVQKTSFTAGPLTFAVKHELWDGNIQDHADQGVAITVTANVAGKQTTLLSISKKATSTGRKTASCKSPGPRCWAEQP